MRALVHAPRVARPAVRCSTTARAAAASPRCAQSARRALRCRARLPRVRASERLQEDEVGNMLPINVDSNEGLGGTSDERFGPDVVLLVGFLREEVPAVRACLDEMGAEFVRVVLLTRELLGGTLRAALEASSGEGAAPATGVPRVLFLSGTSGAEAMAVMDAVQELELPPCIFAAAVPRSVDKQLLDLLDEIHGDNERLAVARRAL